MKKYILCVVATFLLMSNVNTISAQYQNTTIYTPKNTSVTARRFVGTDYTSAQKNDVKNYWLSVYNNRITYQGEATYKYNCHAYAWHVSESGSQVWINTPEQKKYWNDNSYVEVSNPAPSTKVSFGGPCYYWDASQNRYVDECDHSAVTTYTVDYFISKWGPSPLFKHHKNDCPYSIEDLHYYAKPSIIGPTLVLNTGTTYTLNGTNGATVTWTCSTNLKKLSSSGASAVFRPFNPSSLPVLSDGPGWIQASIGGGSPIRYEVWVGKPVITGISGETNIPNQEYPQYTSFTAQFDYKAAIPYNGFQWILNPQKGNLLNGATTCFLDVTFRDIGQYQLRVRATNANGTGFDYVTTVNVYNSPSTSPTSPTSLYQAYPNPVSDELTVSLRTQLSSVPIQSSGGSQTAGNNTYTVYLFNANGASVRQVVSQSGDQMQLDVSGLPDGIYYLLIDAGNGNKPETHKIIVKH